MKNIRAIAKYFSFLASCVTGYDVHVRITDDPSYVGFTSMPHQQKATITLSYKTSLYAMLSTPVIIVMMLGVLAHECLHLCYTNFKALKRKSMVLSRESDRAALHEIHDIIEDPAIEFAAYHKIGGKMLKALATLIKHTWETSPNIEQDIPPHLADEYAYTQVLRAMIHVGDRGAVKGKFLSKTAEDAFKEVLPLMNAAIVEPDGAERVEYAIKIFSILEPLIKKEAEQNQKMSSGKMIPLPDGVGEGEQMPGGNTDQDGEEQEGETIGEGKPTSGEPADEAANGQVVETDENQELNASEQKQKARERLAQQNPTWDNRPFEQSSKDENDLEGIDEDMEFTDDDFDSLMEEIENTETQIQIAEAADAIQVVKAKEDLMMDTDDVINCIANNPNEDSYMRIANAYSSKIATLTNELRKLFMNDRSKVKTSNHGSRVNMKRLVDGKLHSNILLSRTHPKNLDDMAVYLLIDKSGSMSRKNKNGKSNNQCAAETAICLYEALHALKIPVYITGFTSRGHKALHMHYVTWNSSQGQKYTMANFSADDTNYDYLSIQEANHILKKHPAKHKILIVISDGAPCANWHTTNSMDPVAITAAAVENARKTASVLGVAMNCYDENVYAQMYGKDYIAVSTASDMFIHISEAFQQIVKSW